MQIAKKATAELRDAQNKRAVANYPKDLQLMRAIDAGQVPEQPDMSRAAAQEVLGEFYENGLGVQQDCVAARFWYEKAIRTQVDAFAVNMASTHLANLLGAGLGGPKDPARAEALIHQAGGRTQADAIAEEKEREAKLAAFMAALVVTRGQEQGPRSRNQCLAACSTNATYCENNNSFNNTMGIATSGLSLGTLMRNSMQNSDCYGEQRSCEGRCNR